MKMRMRMMMRMMIDWLDKNMDGTGVNDFHSFICSSSLRTDMKMK